MYLFGDSPIWNMNILKLFSSFTNQKDGQFQKRLNYHEQQDDDNKWEKNDKYAVPTNVRFSTEEQNFLAGNMPGQYEHSF